jgi:hypothetical protein
MKRKKELVREEGKREEEEMKEEVKWVGDIPLPTDSQASEIVLLKASQGPQVGAFVVQSSGVSVQ